jgi:hypothetical protein
MVVGLGCTHVPATGVDREGFADPKVTGAENVTLMSAFVGAVWLPAAGDVDAMESGVVLRADVVVVWEPPVVAPECPPVFPPEDDFARP